MNPRQRQEFLNGLANSRIDHKPGAGGEIAILCPQCSPNHDGRRRTLSINTNNNRWHCWRCADLKGREAQIPKLLKVLRLGHLASIFEGDEVIVEDNSLEQVRYRLLFGKDEPVLEIPEVKLPDGYRTDWKTTLIGRRLWRYLNTIRKLSAHDILKYEIGYIISGKYSGCVVLPVYMDGVLRFWQVRRVMFVSTAPKYDSPKTGRSSILFDYDSVTKDNVIVVEGIFDKLAVGGSCVALLGKSISEQQVELLAIKAVETVAVMLDGTAWSDTQRVARTIAKGLFGVRSVLAVRLPFGKDPGNLGRAALKNPVQAIKFQP